MRQIHISAWILVLLSAVLQILIFPLPGVYLLSWIALAPLVLALLRARPSGALQIEDHLLLRPANPAQGFLLGYVCGILWYAGTCYWIFDTMRQYGGLNTAAALLVLFLFCLYLGLYHGFFGLLLTTIAGPGRDDRRALVAAPFLWVAVELARTRITSFPWNLLGVSQVDNVALSRISSWTGVYGISFEIMLVNVALAAAFVVPQKKRTPLIFAALAAAAVLQAGQLIETPQPSADRAALLIQQDIPVSADWNRAYFDSTLDDLSALTVKFAHLNPSDYAPGKTFATKIDLIVWPESPAPFLTNDPLFRNTVSQTAERAGTWMIVGAIGVPGSSGQGPSTPMFNSAALVSPSGEWTTRYDKVHLVPFGEYLPFPKLFSFAGGLTKEVGQFEHGTSRAPLDAGGTRLGIFICYESIFPDEVRQFPDKGAQLLVNISNDGWYGDSGAYAQHLNQTRMRAIENNRWVLSTTDTGVTASIDPSGQLVTELPRKQRTALIAPYGLISETTFYTRHGDWFAYLCAIISIGALILRFISRTEGKQSNESRAGTGIRIVK